MKKFTIDVEMNERWIPHFLSMLDYIETCGKIGTSRYAAIYADGDGDFQPKFKIKGVEWEDVEPFSDVNGDRVYDAG